MVIEARELVDLSGSFIAGLGSSTLSRSPAGDLTLSTRKLTIREGASISSSSIFGLGSGGNLTVTASESIELIGTLAGAPTPGDLLADLGDLFADLNDISAGEQAPGGLFAFAGSGDILNLPNLEAVADSGIIRIDTGELIVRDGVSINVQNLGSGKAGTLEVAADSILLDNQGAISATTLSGKGGDITLEANSLVMRRNSQISATAGGTGNGGNITISGLSPAEFADSAVLLESSNIAANAFQGRGGNIQIDTRVFLPCPDCEITASSELGIDGVVNLNTLDPDINPEVIDLPQELAAPEKVVARLCPADGGQERSEFIITGRGGLPPRPSEPLSSKALVSFDSPAPRAENSSDSSLGEGADTSELPPPARGWYVNAEGVVVLTAQALTATPYGSELTPPECHGK